MLVTRLISILLFASLGDAASTCSDAAFCRKLLSDSKNRISLQKCSQWLVSVSPLDWIKYGKTPLQTVDDVCPQLCNKCKNAGTKTTTPVPATTSKQPATFEDALETDNCFRSLVDGLLDSDVQIVNATDGMERWNMYNEVQHQVTEFNEAGKFRYKKTVNKFSIMKDDEKAPLAFHPLNDPAVSARAASGSTANIQSIIELAERGRKRRERRDVEQIVNWTSHMNVVADQKQCGGCWAFAMRGMLEGTLSMIGMPVAPLSVQQLLDCDTGYSSKYQVSNQGCAGGYFMLAADYLSVTSLTSDDAYPFKGASYGICEPHVGVAPRVLSFDTGFLSNPTKSVLDLQSTAMEERVRIQPVAVGMAITDEIYAYASGIYDGPCGTTINHAVLLVGFTDDYWIIRNSWGASWGENGYMRIARNESDPCMLTTYWAAIESIGTIQPSGVLPPIEVNVDPVTTAPNTSNGTCCDECCDSCEECDEDEEDDWDDSSEDDRDDSEEMTGDEDSDTTSSSTSSTTSTTSTTTTARQTTTKVIITTKAPMIKTTKKTRNIWNEIPFKWFGK